MCTGIMLPSFRGQLATSIYWVQEARRWRQKTHPPHTSSYPRRLYSSTKYTCFLSLWSWATSPVIMFYTHMFAYIIHPTL